MMGQPETPKSGGTPNSTMGALKSAASGDLEGAAMGAIKSKLPPGSKALAEKAEKAMKAVGDAKKYVRYAEIIGGLVSSPGCCIIFIAGALIGIVIGLLTDTEAGKWFMKFASLLSDELNDISKAVGSAAN